MITKATGILNFLRPGEKISSDKGFLIENMCALLGLMNTRPHKAGNNLKQFSANSTARTQLVANTRIIIEQVNRRGKGENRYFLGPVPILQTDLLSSIMRVCFCMANYRCPILKKPDV